MCRYRNKSYVCSHVLAFRPLWWHSVGADVFVLRRRRRFVSFVCLPLLKKYILIFPHALCCELFSGRDDGHRERRHEEERVFTRRARIEEFPQCGRGFSVRTFVASFVLRVRLIIRIRALRVVLLCGVASMTRRDSSAISKHRRRRRRRRRRRSETLGYQNAVSFGRGIRVAEEKRKSSRRVEKMMREDESALRADDD